MVYLEIPTYERGLINDDSFEHELFCCPLHLGRTRLMIRSSFRNKFIDNCSCNPSGISNNYSRGSREAHRPLKSSEMKQ